MGGGPFSAHNADLHTQAKQGGGAPQGPGGPPSIGRRIYLFGPGGALWSSLAQFRKCPAGNQFAIGLHYHTSEVCDTLSDTWDSKFCALVWIAAAVCYGLLLL